MKNTRTPLVRPKNGSPGRRRAKPKNVVNKVSIADLFRWGKWNFVFFRDVWRKGRLPLADMCGRCRRVIGVRAATEQIPGKGQCRCKDAVEQALTLPLKLQHRPSVERLKIASAMGQQETRDVDM